MYQIILRRLLQRKESWTLETMSRRVVSSTAKITRWKGKLLTSLGALVPERKQFGRGLFRGARFIELSRDLLRMSMRSPALHSLLFLACNRIAEP